MPGHALPPQPPAWRIYLASILLFPFMIAYVLVGKLGDKIAGRNYRPFELRPDTDDENVVDLRKDPK